MLTTALPHAVSRWIGPKLRAGWFAAGVAVCLCIAATAGYQRLYSSFAPYDDEGYVMLSLRSFLAGEPLYDATFSQYGPAYYTLNGVFHRVTGAPVTHDVARMKTLVAWLLAAVLGAGTVNRLTGDRWITLAALIAGYCHLDRLGLEPGHPQEVCVLAVLGCLFVASDKAWGTNRRRDPRHNSRAPSETWLPVLGRCHVSTPRLALLLSLSVLTAVALMTKLNVGVFLGLSLTLALLAETRSGCWRSVALLAAVLAGAVGPFLLIGPPVFHVEGLQLPFVVSAGVLSAGVYVWARERRRAAAALTFATLRPCAAFLTVVGAASLTFALCAWLHGTSVSGLYEGLIGQHRRFAGDFFSRPPIFAAAVPAALGSLVLAIIVAWCGVDDERFTARAIRYARFGLVALAIALCLRDFSETFRPLTDGVIDRGLAAVLVSFLTPLAWLVLLPSGSANEARRGNFGRTALCFVAVLQPLTAHPIPGTQMATGSIGLLLILLVCFADWRRAAAAEPTTSAVTSDATFARWATVCVVGVLLVTVCGRAAWNTHQRSQRESLNLSGARWLRLPADEVAEKRWLVARLQEQADSFLCMPSGCHSLHLWAELPPPTSWNTTIWPRLLSDQQQRDVIAALDKSARPCVVVDRSLMPPSQPDARLVRYCNEHFEPIERRGRTELWFRRDNVNN